MKELLFFIVGGLSGAGVVAAVIGFLSKWFVDRAMEGYKAKLSQETERLKSELVREGEAHKLKLKKQELLFGKELEAASEFFDLSRRIRPEFRHPDMEWDEAMDDVLENMMDTESKIGKFLSKHEPILDQSITKKLKKVLSMATAHKFTSAGYGGNLKEARESASDLIKLLDEIEALFVRRLNSDS